ncbi:MAG: hypothetical protein E6G10_12685 [Actinobacteria bacterium]|nr:MAG: hypothetical protein E6G10_12685 [Actinomycetota bacterium]
MEVNTGTAVAAGAISLVLSERVRDTLRKGVVYGLAGVISAGDAVVGAARGAVDEAQSVRGSNGRGASRKTATAKT